MRIGIDARELSGKPTGVGRYLACLLDEWMKPDGPAGEFRLYSPTHLEFRISNPRFTACVVPGGSGTRWEQFRLPRALAGDRLDVFFAPAYTAPLGLNVPVALTIHDLSFLAHPEWFAPRERWRRGWLTRRSAARARVILTVSMFSKTEIVERLRVPEARVRVVPHGVRLPDGPPFTTAPREPLVLFAGSIFNRRRVPDLIRAFAPIAREHPGARLEVVGENRSYPRQDLAQVVTEAAVGDTVGLRAWVPDEELARLYGRARAFAFLSEYEGFGLPPLEALAAGVPPVLLDTPVAREVCGDAALYVAAGDREACTAALRALLFDETVRARVLAAAPAELARYNWARAASATIAAIRDAAG